MQADATQNAPPSAAEVRLVDRIRRYIALHHELRRREGELERVGTALEGEVSLYHSKLETLRGYVAEADRARGKGNGDNYEILRAVGEVLEYNARETMGESGHLEPMEGN